MPFKIVRNDITKMTVDAIVNTSNPAPTYADGSDTAVYKAAGAELLLREREKIGFMEIGETAVTPAFALSAKYIIHTVGPVYWGGTMKEAEQLYSCYENCLYTALEHACESIAFPLISTGTYRYPKDEAMQIALSAISRFLSREEMMVYLVVFDEEAFSVSRKLFADIDEYIDRNYVQDVLEIEYQNDGIPAPFPRFYEPPCPSMVKEASIVYGESFRVQEESEREHKEFTDLYEDSFDLYEEPSIIYEDSSIDLDETEAESGKSKKISRSLDDLMAELQETFQEKLLRMIDEKGCKDVDIYKKANLSRKLFSKIRCNPEYRPKKMTAVALAIALELNLDETIDLLARAELAFSPSSKFDIIIKYFIEREVYDIYTINLALFEHNLPILGE